MGSRRHLPCLGPTRNSFADNRGVFVPQSLCVAHRTDSEKLLWPREKARRELSERPERASKACFGLLGACTEAGRPLRRYGGASLPYRSFKISLLVKPSQT